MTGTHEREAVEVRAQDDAGSSMQVSKGRPDGGHQHPPSGWRSSQIKTWRVRSLESMGSVVSEGEPGAAGPGTRQDRLGDKPPPAGVPGCCSALGDEALTPNTCMSLSLELGSGLGPEKFLGGGLLRTPMFPVTAQGGVP